MGVSALADDKIEGTEFLMQQLTLTSPTQDAVDNAGNIFFQNASTITIIDVTGNYEYYFIGLIWATSSDIYRSNGGRIVLV